MNRHHSHLHVHECELACDQAAEEDELTIAVGEVVEVNRREIRRENVQRYSVIYARSTMIYHILF